MGHSSSLPRSLALTPMLQWPLPDCWALPLHSVPSAQGATACTGGGRPAQPSGPELPYYTLRASKALCLGWGLRPALLCESPLPLAGLNLSAGDLAAGTPQNTGVMPWRGQGTKATQSQAWTGHGPSLPCRVLMELHSISLETKLC